MFLVLVVLSMTAALLREYGAVRRFESRRSALLESSQLALEKVATEALSAVDFIEPDLATATLPMGVPGSRLSFRRIVPNHGSRLPDPVVASLSWEPLAAADLVTVVYEAGAGGLVRSVDGRSLVMGEYINSLGVRFLSSRRLELSLSVDLENRVVRSVRSVYLPGVRQ